MTFFIGAGLGGAAGMLYGLAYPVIAASMGTVALEGVCGRGYWRYWEHPRCGPRRVPSRRSRSYVGRILALHLPRSDLLFAAARHFDLQALWPARPTAESESLSVNESSRVPDFAVALALGGSFVSRCRVCFRVSLENYPVINSYAQFVLVTVGINIILSTSLNLVNGYMGEFSVGHAGFMSLGAYASAVLTTKWLPDAPWAFFPSVLFGGMVAASIGFLLAVLSFKTRRLSRDHHSGVLDDRKVGL